MTIPEFISARLDEWEATARAATPGPWEKTTDGSDFMVHAAYGSPQDGGIIVDAFDVPTDAAHIAANDPAHVLRTTARLREIVALHRPHDHHGGHGEYVFCTACQWDHGDDSPRSDMPIEEFGAPCPTLRALAAIWSDHDDYDAGWVP